MVIMKSEQKRLIKTGKCAIKLGLYLGDPRVSLPSFIRAISLLQDINIIYSQSNNRNLSCGDK